MSNILLDICECFDVSGFKVSRFYSIATSSSMNSVQTCFAINKTFASSTQHVKMDDVKG